MKRLISVLLLLMMVSFAIAENTLTVEDLEDSMGYDIDTSDAYTLKVIIDAWDTELKKEMRVYDELIQKCLKRLIHLGETEWVNEYTQLNKTDLLKMSYAELIELKDKINLAIWQSQEWQEVIVPQGTWKVGEDIPAGTWVVKCADMGRTNYMLRHCEMQWGESLHKSGRYVNWSGRYDTNINIYNPNHRDYETGLMTEYILTVEDGDYIIISGTYNQAVFTPYTGKPSLGFK